MRATKHPVGYRKVTIAIAVLSCMATFVAINNVTADVVVTDPVGFITLKAVGTNGPPAKNPFFTQIALGMSQVPDRSGIATTNGAKKLQLNSALTEGQYNRVIETGGLTNSTYYIEITSGTYAGLLNDIVSNNTANVFTVDDLTSYVVSNQTFKIYPQWTFGKLFGPTNSVGLAGGSGSANADNVEVWNPYATPQAFAVYYYKTTTLQGTGWRSGASATINQSNTVLYVERGILIGRRVSGTVSFPVVGAVKLGTTISPIVGGSGTRYTWAGNVYPAGIQLGQSLLYTGSTNTGVAGGSSVANADNVQIWNTNTASYTIYYFKTTTLQGTGWRSGASATISCATSNIPAGQPAVIVRKIPGGFDWYMPQLFTP